MSIRIYKLGYSPKFKYSFLLLIIVVYFDVCKLKRKYKMKFFQQLQIKRRSVRKYTQELLSSDETKLILEAALLSPTSKNKHSWSFIAVEDKDTLKALSVCKPHSAAFVADAAMAVVIAGNPLISNACVEDASIAAINMQMQAEELGIGSCWVQVRSRNYSETITSGEYINDLLNIPMPLEVVCVISFGKKEKERTPADIQNLRWEKVHIDKYEFEPENGDNTEL